MLILNGARAMFAAGVVAMAAAPFLFDANHVVLLTEFMSMLVLAVMWNLLAGYADIVTVGQHAYVGVGAYAFFGFAALAGVNPYLSIVLAGLVALAIAVPTMILIFRLRTAYLAIGTWVVAELLMLASGKLDWDGDTVPTIQRPTWSAPTWIGRDGSLTTDSDGRFVLNGLGPNRVGMLRIIRQGLETAYVAVLDRTTGVGAKVHGQRSPTFSSLYGEMGLELYGTKFEHVLGPSKPITGITASKTPKITAIRSRRSRSTPDTPIAVAAPKLSSPTDTATRSSASTIERT